MRVADADFVEKVKLNTGTIARASQPKLIAVAVIGTDKIDLAACQQRGVLVSNVHPRQAHSARAQSY